MSRGLGMIEVDSGNVGVGMGNRVLSINNRGFL